MKNHCISLIFCILSCFSIAEGKQTNEFVFQTADKNIKITFCTPSLFRVQISKSLEFPKDETWMVRKYKFEPITVSKEEKDKLYILSTDSLHLIIDKQSLGLKIYNAKKALLYSERDLPRFNNDTVQTTVELQPEEHFFGFGERMDFLDQRGHKVSLNVELGHGRKPAVGGKDILRANYCPVPFMMSTKGYGLFFHNSYRTIWDMGWTSPSFYSFKAVDGDLDYYFIYGPDFYTMLDLYTDLTGKSPLLPKFAMGLHVGTYSGGTWKHEEMTSDKYPVDLCKRFRQEKIPFDLLWLDSTWRLFNGKYGNGGCSFEWRETFKDPEAMFKGCYEQHVQMVGLHIRSILDNGPKYHLLDRAKEEGYVLYPGAKTEGLVNFFNPKAVDWWWKNGVMKVASIGAKFVKTDVGGTMDIPGLHNLFPLAYAEASFLKFQKYNQMRGLDHTREGYAGIQRYPYIWAGDWGSEWQWFEPVIRAGLNIGMSGVGFWTHCMGGFEQYSPYDTELYMRWVQFGMFSPIALLFGMDHPRYHEPWTYGKEALNNFIKYDSLRYTLIPYIYTCAYQTHKTGRPIMAPLVMDYPQDENTYQLSRQYMFGPSMMVCPVTTKGALSQSVYFPGGVWFDYETGERYEGRQYKSFLTPLDVLPIYIKGGAIIPQQPAMQWVDEKEVNTITLDVYPCGDSSFTMYEDEGKNQDYEKGIFSLTSIQSVLNNSTWMLSINKPHGAYVPSSHNYLVKAYLPYTPSTVVENGEELSLLSSINEVKLQTGWFFDKDSKRLWVNTKSHNNQTIKLKVE